MYRLQTLTPVTVKQCFAATKAEGDVDWSFEGHGLGHVKRDFYLTPLFFSQHVVGILGGARRPHSTAGPVYSLYN